MRYTPSTWMNFCFSSMKKRKEKEREVKRGRAVVYAMYCLSLF